MIAEHVATELRGGQKCPIGANRSFQSGGQQRTNVSRCLRQLGSELFLSPQQHVLRFDQLPLRLNHVDEVQLVLGERGQLREGCFFRGTERSWLRSCQAQRANTVAPGTVQRIAGIEANEWRIHDKRIVVEPLVLERVRDDESSILEYCV